jgi:small conductance mechanosensitive channel
MMGFMEQVGGFPLLVFNTFKAFVVLIIGWTVAGTVSGIVRRRLNAVEQRDPTLGNFVASLAKWVILLVAVLGMFGVQATSLVAILGASTLAIGLALRGTLSDFAAGFMLILFRPYKLGQYVDVDRNPDTSLDRL